MFGPISWEEIGGKEAILKARREGKTFEAIALELSQKAGRQIGKSSIRDYARREGFLQELQEAGPQGHQAFKLPDRELDVEAVKDREIMNLRRQNKELNKRNDRLLDRVLKQEDLVDRIVAESTEPLPAPDFQRFTSTGKKERDVILPMYDMQFGQHVRPVDTPGGIGAFSAEIFERRLVDRYVPAVIAEVSDHAASHTEEQFVVVLGGDCVEGDEIFRGQSRFLEFDPVEQVLKLAHLLGGALHELFGFAVEELGVKRTALLMLPGNHGKAIKGAAPATFSWDYLLYKMLEEKLSNYPVDVMGTEPAGALYFKSQSKVFLAMHGDEVKGWGSIPFYGLTRQDAKSLRLTHQIFDYGLIGHHHQSASIPIGYGKWFMSGNWVGANEYTKAIQATNAPEQSIIFSSEKYGAYPVPILLENLKVPETHVYLDEPVS